jgi:NAD(P)-dependent dehydrogenase (short-subunit alcohol dehydrogenase family)
MACACASINKIELKDVPAASQSLNGKVVVFSGGSDGMGKVACEKLAAMGAEVVLLGRSPEKTTAVVNAINAKHPGKSRFIKCDLASLASVRACAEAVLQTTPKIHILVNCAGANASERKLTEDGFESMWQVNHLGPFLLTNLLLTRVKESVPSRIVQLSSATEKWGHIDLDDLQKEKGWSLFRSYASAKLAMNMCVRRLSKDLQGTQVTINALNPGFIQTNLVSATNGCNACLGKPLMRFFSEPTENGADRIITAAIAPQYDGVSGEFIYETYVRDPNPEALDDVLVEKVWNVSRQHVRLA